MDTDAAYDRGFKDGMAAARTRSRREVPVIAVGSVILDRDAELVTARGKEIRMPGQMRSVLEYLMLHTGKIVPLGDMAVALFGYDDLVDAEGLIRVQVCKLRKKLAEAGVLDYVKTVPRAGYRVNHPKEGYST